MRNMVFQFTSLLLLLAVSSVAALAQYGGGGGMGGSGTGSGSTSTGVYTAPKSGYGGNGAAIGAGVGAAAAAAGLTYWALHRRPDVVGCVQSSGKTLMNEKDGRVYELLPDNEVYLKPGERVALKGKKTDDGGTYRFLPHKLVKDYGACEAGKPTATTARAWPK